MRLNVTVFNMTEKFATNAQMKPVTSQLSCYYFHTFRFDYVTVITYY